VLDWHTDVAGRGRIFFRAVGSIGRNVVLSQASVCLWGRGDARCEGFYQSPVSAGGLELVSLTAGAVDYKLRSDGTVHITALHARALNSADVRVQARALPLGTYYRMDAPIPASGSMAWPMTAVLAPAKLTADTIGVIAWFRNGTDQVFVPVAVSDRPPPTAGPTSIVAILRSPVDLDELRWRSRRDNSSGKPSEWKKFETGAHALRAGQSIRLELASAQGAGLVEVSAKTAKSDRWLSLQMRVFEP
jgi:hypothetical protein